MKNPKEKHHHQIPRTHTILATSKQVGSYNKND